MIANLLYNAGSKKETTKYFVTKVMAVGLQEGGILLSFMKKKGQTVIFPPNQDEFMVQRFQILQILNYVNERRGYYSFGDKLGYEI